MGRLLKEFAEYSTDRIALSEVTIENYVTTDNLLQNKQGKTNLESLPPNGVNVTKYEKGDILISNIRPYLKKIWYAKYGGGSSADVLTLQVKKDYDSKFIYYNLFRDEFFEHMMNGSKGTKMPRGDKNQILNFPISDYDLSTQKSIAKVLSDLDAKIEINNRINEELESLAKTIYDYWFVQFDFPNKEGKPYKSSGGKMVYNDKLKREIPEGWEVKKLSEIANITMGQSPSGTSYNEVGDGMIFFQGSTDFGWRYPENRVYTTEPKRLANEDDILLSVRAPVGTMNIAMNDCCIGRGLCALNSKDGFSSFLFYQMNYFKKKFDYLNSVGTTFGSLNKDELFNLELAYPERSILSRFEEIVSRFDTKIKINVKQNQELSTLRDWLLPMLMNGQVSVGD